MPATRFLLAAAAVMLAVPVTAAPRVVADLAPVHSVVARIMQGAGAPDLLLPPGASPHGYALRPSEAAALEAAEIVFWIGPAYTPWLAEPLATLAADARRVALQEAEGMTLLPVRDSGPFDAHDHDHDYTHDLDHDAETHTDAHHDAAPSGTIDGHLWLDPLNAAAIAAAAAAALADADPENADLYRANADEFAAEMAALTEGIADRLAPLRNRPFLVFHDAYQYFESRFDLPAAGSIALHDSDQPGPARMADIRARVRDQGVVCAFAEPQFDPALMETALEGTTARRAKLDPIGSTLEPGPDLYPALIHALADALATCLPEAD